MRQVAPPRSPRATPRVLAQTTLVATFLMTTAVTPSWPVVPRTYFLMGEGSPFTLMGSGSSPSSQPLMPTGPSVPAVVKTAFTSPAASTRVRATSENWTTS